MIQKNIIINNLKISYYLSSELDFDKDILVFLNGWQSQGLVFKKIVQDKNNVVLLDIPGCGGSDIPKDIWGLSEYAVFLENFLEKLKILNPILIGHSFGGSIIIKYLSKEKQAQKAILIGSAGVRTKSVAIKFWSLASKILKIPFNLLFPKKIKEKIRKKFYKMIGSDYLESGELKEIYGKIINEDLQEEMQKIKIPITLIWGELDQETPLENGVLMNKLIKNSRLEIIKNAGHYSFLDQEEEFKKVFNKALDSVII